MNINEFQWIKNIDSLILSFYTFEQEPNNRSYYYQISTAQIENGDNVTVKKQHPS